MSDRKSQPDWWSTKRRDAVLFVFGLAGVVHETLARQIDRPVLLAVFAGFCGLPVFLNRDEKAAPPKDDPGDDA